MGWWSSLDLYPLYPERIRGVVLFVSGEDKHNDYSRDDKYLFQTLTHFFLVMMAESWSKNDGADTVT